MLSPFFFRNGLRPATLPGQKASSGCDHLFAEPDASPFPFKGVRQAGR